LASSGTICALPQLAIQRDGIGYGVAEEDRTRASATAPDFGIDPDTGVGTSADASPDTSPDTSNAAIAHPGSQRGVILLSPLVSAINSAVRQDIASLSFGPESGAARVTATTGRE
jgi:hypothetical protein